MATYIYGRETSPNEKVYTSEDYEKLRQELAQTKAELAECRQGEIDQLKCMLNDERDENKRLREACLLAIEQRDHEHKTAKRLRYLLQQTKEYVGGRNCTRVLIEEIIAATDGGE